MPSAPAVTKRLVIPVVIAILVSGVAGYYLGSLRVPPAPAAPATAQVARRPLVGIASRLGMDYVEAVRRAGGTPVVLPEGPGDAESVHHYLAALDALLLPGGADIPPAAYGEDPHPTVEPLTESRWNFERELATRWLHETDKPFLGICLGGQMLNVVSGGSLVQDIPTTFGTNHRGPAHTVTIEKSSRLARILGRTELEVNSSHHQAVKEIAPGLVVVARSPEGIPEAIERPGHRFVLGVQWHPERMSGDQTQSRLFEAFIKAAGQEPNPAD
jgi:putative glutamine amidotransferase